MTHFNLYDVNKYINNALVQRDLVSPDWSDLDRNTEDNGGLLHISPIDQWKDWNELFRVIERDTCHGYCTEGGNEFLQTRFIN